MTRITTLAGRKHSWGLLMLLSIMPFGLLQSQTSPPPLDGATLNPKKVFLSVLSRIEVLPFRQRFAELGRFVDEVQQAIVKGNPSASQVRHRRRQLLLGLGLLFDTSDLLEETALTRRTFAGLPTEKEKVRRRATCDMVFLNGRSDASKHFFLSAAITTLLGPALAERIGRNKESKDARRRELDSSGQGFSFNDLAHDLAGIRYATHLLEGSDEACKTPPPPLSAFTPTFEGLNLPEGLEWTTFRAKYYGTQRSEYDKITRTIHAALDRALKGE